MAAANWIDGTGNWTTAADWSTGSVPGAGDGVVIPFGTVQLTTPITVASITLSTSVATLQVADPGGTESVTGNLANSGTLDVDGPGLIGGSPSPGGTPLASG